MQLEKFVCLTRKYDPAVEPITRFRFGNTAELRFETRRHFDIVYAKNISELH